MVQLDAAAGGERAHRGAAAEVGDDHPAAGDLRRDLGEAVGDVLVAEAVEAVAADALVVEGARQGVAVGVSGWPRWKAVSKQATCGRSGSIAVDDADRRRGCAAGAAAPAAGARQAGEDGGVDAAPGGRSRGRRGRRGGRRRGARRRSRVGEPAASASVGRGQVGELGRRARLRSTSGAPSASVARRRGWTPMPSIWPRTRRSSAPATAAKQLELEARRAGVDDEDRLHASDGRAPAAVRRRALA